jgi:uncharacterized protein (TIGR02996 family)
MMLLLDHGAFLDKLRDDPADVTNWLVYADWLTEQDDPTAEFVRLSLDFTAGRVPIEPHYAHITRLNALAKRADPATRELMAEYRSNLPLRLQVYECIRVGHNPPRDIFGFERTHVMVAILSGRLALGTWLRSEDGAWQPTRPVRGMEVLMKHVERVEAGRAPTAVGLYYLDHHALPVGAILVEGRAPELDRVG